MTNTTLRRGTAATVLTAMTAGLIATAPATAAPKPATAVPDRVVLSARLLPTGSDLLFDSGQYANQPTANGQYCDTTDNGATGNEPRPILGRQWMWTNTTSESSITEVVTSWADGKGALADLRNDTGYCRFAALDHPGFSVVQATASAYTATWYGYGGATAVASRLVGNTIVSVTYDSPAGTTISKAASTASALADSAAKRIKSTKLP